MLHQLDGASSKLEARVGVGLLKFSEKAPDRRAPCVRFEKGDVAERPVCNDVKTSTHRRIAATSNFITILLPSDIENHNSNFDKRRDSDVLLLKLDPQLESQV